MSDRTPTLYEWAGGAEALERLTEQAPVPRWGLGLAPPYQPG
jgi:hypothetical protein